MTPKKPYDVNDVADYIIKSLKTDASRVSLVHLKLQKLVYYVQAWSLGINQAKMINTEFEAWVHGPVSRELYDRFKDTKNLYSEITLEDIRPEFKEENIQQEDREFIDYILENYAGFTGVELVQMTHREEPWLAARVGVESADRCTNLLDDKLIEKYYGQRYSSI